MNYDGPNLLIEWSSPWDEFRSAVLPALQKSEKRLAGEAHGGLFPYQGMMLSWILEVLLLIAVIVIPPKLDSTAPNLQAARPKYDVIYYSGEELPRTEDFGGAPKGLSGRAGGKEAFHPTQTIRVARGDSLVSRVVDAPNLKLPHSTAEVANLLAFAPVLGAPPAEGLKSARSMTLPQAAAVAPAPEVSRDTMQAAPSLNARIVAPTPSAPQRDLQAMQLPGSHSIQVVPPTVSAPEQVSSAQARLTLPAPTVVAPAPTMQVPREVALNGPGFGPGEMHKQVVPPPVQISGTARQGQGQGFATDVAVVPPPVQVNGSARQGQGLGSSGSVVPPPVQLSDGAIDRHPAGGLGGGTVVGPAPSIGGNDAAGGLGRGNRGGGRGGPMDIGDVAAPPTAGGSGGAAGVVVSNRPGSDVGLPGNGGAGAIAMSPSGGKEPGLGGSGAGTGIGRGSGQGSGFSGEGPGAGKEGSGRGSDPNARSGISPYPGPGGAGSGTNGTPAMPGVSVHGGSSNVVTLPSFGSDPNHPDDPVRSSVGKDDEGPGITIVASSRSGGAFNFYGALKGDKVYTIYIDTVLGPASMQFADPTSSQHPYAEDLISPRPVRADLPPGLPHSRLVVACVLDRTGVLRNLRVLEPGGAVMTSKILASLPSWKFRPASRGGQAIEVNAILGFNIDVADRN